MISFYMIIICASALFFSLVGTYSIKYLLQMFSVSRNPNERDNHKVATPKGGGIAVMISAIGFLCVVGANSDMLFGLVILTIISAIDDFRGLKPSTRLIFHSIAALIMVAQINQQIIPQLPPLAEYALLSLGLVWFMNIYNFMDGIDEITALQTTMICLGLVIAAMIIKVLPNSIAYDAFVVIASVAGFWYFNRHPASIFLGDSGSIPLGALMGWMLIYMASKGLWSEALIIPAYYLVDSGITFIKRLLTGKTPWEAHSEHGYQVFVRAGNSHNIATKFVIFYNFVALGLFGTSLYLPQFKLFCLGGAYITALLLYAYFMSGGVGKKTNQLKKYASS